MTYHRNILIAAVSAIALSAAAPVLAADDNLQGSPTVKPMTPSTGTPGANGSSADQVPGNGLGNDGGIINDTDATANMDPDWVHSQNFPADKLVGATVVNADNDSIGEVEKVVNLNGRDTLIVSVGEFLGMGGHTVALELDKSKVFHHRNDMDDIRITTDMTEEQLKAQPSYDAAK